MTLIPWFQGKPKASSAPKKAQKGGLAPSEEKFDLRYVTYKSGFLKVMRQEDQVDLVTIRLSYDSYCSLRRMVAWV